MTISNPNSHVHFLFAIYVMIPKCGHEVNEKGEGKFFFIEVKKEVQKVQEASLPPIKKKMNKGIDIPPFISIKYRVSSYALDVLGMVSPHTVVSMCLRYR